MSIRNCIIKQLIDTVQLIIKLAKPAEVKINRYSLLPIQFSSIIPSNAKPSFQSAFPSETQSRSVPSNKETHFIGADQSSSADDGCSTRILLINNNNNSNKRCNNRDSAAKIQTDAMKESDVSFPRGNDTREWNIINSRPNA